ncbi:hypothetical protein NE237_031833 [Protea cynaroides]|uniref:Integrase catalytic domain-containing protein n=1 Tax=Protea cynaroides TaxID=273540 RepID=A0A9Q0L2D0_9MAGN|nr:hypothetical protein NE237_031833 [Protea cynaroides]
MFFFAITTDDAYYSQRISSSISVQRSYRRTGLADGSVIYLICGSFDLVHAKRGKKIKHLHTDNGLEFCSKEFDRFCKDEGIARHHTVRDTPQQNGVAERMNSTLLERVRCLLSNAGLGRSYWVEAINTVCYLVNRSPTTATDYKTPIEVEFEITPSDSHDDDVIVQTDQFGKDIQTEPVSELNQEQELEHSIVSARPR